MALGKYDNQIWLGSGADFADAGALAQAGVRLAVLIGAPRAYAHTDGIFHLAFTLPAPAPIHDATLKALTKFILSAPIALCGVLDDPDFALTLGGVVAEKTAVSFQAAMTVLAPRGINLDASPAALNQGKRVWP